MAVIFHARYVKIAPPCVRKNVVMPERIEALDNQFAFDRLAWERALWLTRLSLVALPRGVQTSPVEIRPK
jgi:hypothetical protein